MNTNPMNNHSLLRACLLSIACAVLLIGCKRHEVDGKGTNANVSDVKDDNIKAGAGVDSMTNKPWATININASDANLALWVQCDGDTAQIGIKSPTPLTSSDGMSVLVKFSGEQSATSEIWGTTTDHKGAIRNADTAIDTDTFIKKLITSQAVQFRVTPIGSDVIDASFSTRGFAQKLSLYGDHCGWGQLLRQASEPAASQ